jgi:hypothetical protein
LGVAIIRGTGKSWERWEAEKIGGPDWTIEHAKGMHESRIDRRTGA